MAIAIGQHPTFEDISGAVTSVTTTGVATTNGSTFVVFAACNSGWGATPITDSKGNTYTQIQSNVTAFGVTGTLWYKSNGTGGAAHTFTATATGSAAISIWVVELTGADAASFDQSAAGNDDLSSPFTSGTTGTTAIANEMALVFQFDNRTANSPTWSGGYTTIDDLSNTSGVTGTSANLLLSATGTQQSSFTLTTATDCVSFIATFKQAVTGPTLSAPTPSGRLTTSTTATIGCTTDTATGTFYCVVDSPANLNGVTLAQIKAGQKASGASALASASSAVSNTTPSAGVTGLSAGVRYAYAIAQNDGTNDSTNTLGGTFTTDYPVSLAWRKA